VAVLIEQQRHRDLLHYACRDRTLMGFSRTCSARTPWCAQSSPDNGDRADGSYPDATSVYDVDSIGLTTW